MVRFAGIPIPDSPNAARASLTFPAIRLRGNLQPPAETGR